MLYEIGVIVLFLSAAFCGGSVLVPLAIASIGVLMMTIGRRLNDEKQNGTDK